MTLIPYDHFRNWENWRREWERFFNSPSILNPNFSGPRMDVHETENEVVAICEVPGLEKKEDIQIDVHDQMLSIAGQTTRTDEVKEDQMYRRERYMGRFQRSVNLPAKVVSEGTRASYKNGILEVRMPKAHPDATRRIDVDFS